MREEDRESKRERRGLVEQVRNEITFVFNAFEQSRHELICLLRILSCKRNETRFKDCVAIIQLVIYVRGLMTCVSEYNSAWCGISFNAVLSSLPVLSSL